MNGDSLTEQNLNNLPIYAILILILCFYEYFIGLKDLTNRNSFSLKKAFPEISIYFLYYIIFMLLGFLLLNAGKKVFMDTPSSPLEILLLSGNLYGWFKVTTKRILKTEDKDPMFLIVIINFITNAKKKLIMKCALLRDEENKAISIFIQTKTITNSHVERLKNYIQISVDEKTFKRNLVRTTLAKFLTDPNNKETHLINILNEIGYDHLNAIKQILDS